MNAARRGDGRVPPHNLSAEESVLGAMLLDRQARFDVVESQLAVGDFYKPAHQFVFDAIISMHRADVPVDAVTVVDELKRAGLLEEMGGPGLILELQNATPAISNARRYAKIIQDASLLRQMIYTAAGMAELAYNEPDDVVRALTEAQASVSELLDSADLRLLRGYYEDMGTIDPGGDRSMSQPWIGQGFLRRMQRLLVVAKAGIGKALALDTPIRTTTRWATMGSIRPGEFVFTPDGTPTMVVGCSDIHDEEAYAVTFDDGSVIVAGARHMWETIDFAGRNNYHWERRVVTTEQIAASITVSGTGKRNHLVECAAPIANRASDLPFDPYLLGYWLGDGHSRQAVITVHDSDADHLLDAIARAGLDVGTRHSYEGTSSISLVAGLDDIAPRTMLQHLGVIGHKHIPWIYMNAHIDDRLALLRGIVDSDGHVSTDHGRIEVTLCNQRLASDVFDLVLGLGIKVTSYASDAKLSGRVVGTRHRMTFQTSLTVVSVPRKLTRWQPATVRAGRRYIVSCEPVGTIPVRCIQVDRTDGMWLAGRQLIPTHNSVFLRQIAFCCENGVHPFTGQPTERERKSLVVELEAGEWDISSSMRDLLAALQRAKQTATLGELNRPGLLHRPGGIDIRSPEGYAVVEAAIRRRKPELVVMGPVKYLSIAKPGENYEIAALNLMFLLNRLMEKYDFALGMEVHFSRGDHGSPGGSERWVDWPDVGFGIHPPNDDVTARLVTGGDGIEMTVKQFRTARDSDIWLPAHLIRGAARKLPWSVIDRPDPYRYGTTVFAARYGAVPDSKFTPYDQQEF